MHKLFIYSFLLFFFACDSGPKVIEAEAVEPHSHAGSGVDAALQSTPAMAQTANTEEHKVSALESLDTDKYTYVRVKENDQEFWIATTKTPIEIGATYYYKGGLIKKNFQSREHNRVFETLYLVGGISAKPAGSAVTGSAVDQALNGGHAHADITPPSEVKAVSGAIKLGDLAKNASKYAGKSIKVTGKVMKVNQMIMGKNWLHLQDGTGDNYDLTVTTMENIPPGHVVSMEGVITLDKDFGAGYRYAILMEDATLIKQ